MGLCIYVLCILYCIVEDGVVCVVDGVGGEWVLVWFWIVLDLKFW